ncbi:MAG: xanthine dehydrogenase family protein molybdopterin-binding subunit [Elusimicrobiota bacterium]
MPAAGHNFLGTAAHFSTINAVGVVGTSPGRKEGPQKLCGVAKYIDDFVFPGCLWGVTFRSSIAYGLIKKITLDPAFPWEDCVVACAKDIPGNNFVSLIENDQPLLADKKTMHPMEPILLVAHTSRHRAYEALNYIRAEYECKEPVLSLEESLAKKRVIYGRDNVFKKFLIKKGSVKSGFAQADVIVEGEYRVPHQEQAYIENNGMAAYVDKKGVLTVVGSMQCPYYVQKTLKQIFNLPDNRVRVAQAVTGGGFGGKEEYPSILAGHAALLAWKAKRPVKMIYDRREDMAATTKRHPAWIKHKTGLTRAGRLVAQEIDIVMDGGAYATLSSVVLSRGTIHATGPYECPNVRVRSKAVATNTPPNGAFRGFGAPQTLFAVELHWEKIARVLRKDSLELRQLNLLKTGSITATGQTLSESVGAEEALQITAKKSDYLRKKKRYARWNRDNSRDKWHGIGLAVVHHGAGFTGSGEISLASRAAISLTRDGKIQILASSTEIGQGANTVLAQIVSETLGIPFDAVSVKTPDTHKVPDSGPTVASRTCMVVGGLLQCAAGALKSHAAKRLGRFPKNAKDWKTAAVLLCGKKPERRFEAGYKKPKELLWDDPAYRGDAYGVYSYAALAADLEVDKTTYAVRIRKITTAQDIGKAIHPLLAEGQIIGGIAQGIGYALLENSVFKNGVMQNSQLTNYMIPTSVDVAPTDVTIVENPYSRGPFGAKGLGELPMNAPAPAIAAAIYCATGRMITELPILPEKIAKSLEFTQK